MFAQHGEHDGAVHPPATAVGTVHTPAAAAAGGLFALPEPCQDDAAGLQLTTHTSEVSMHHNPKEWVNKQIGLLVRAHLAVSGSELNPDLRFLVFSHKIVNKMLKESQRHWCNKTAFVFKVRYIFY